MKPYWSDETTTLHLGDCLEVLPSIPDASVAAVVTDPPYGLEFMGREWDSFKPSKSRIRTRADGRTNPADGKSVTSTPESYTAGQPFQEWCEAWARECLRILKPGGWLLAFGATRTWHRLACGIEDAGFEIRDSVADLTGQDAPGLMWSYGSGFPKSSDVARMVDMEVCPLPGRHFMRKVPASPRPGDHVCPESAEGKPWQGWGTALKPGWEPVIVARKPVAGTVAANVLEHGTGGLNISACRVEFAGPADLAGSEAKNQHADHGNGARENSVLGDMSQQPRANYDGQAGRWPPNVLLTHSADCDDYACGEGCPAAELDRQTAGTRASKPSKTGSHGTSRGNVYGGGAGLPREYALTSRDDTGGASRFFPQFRYEPKAPATERPQLADGTQHPTVKPVAVIRWLARLVTPPGGRVLDLFAGSGTTGEACALEGFPCVLIEKDPASAELIKVRMSRPIQPDLFGGAA